MFYVCINCFPVIYCFMLDELAQLKEYLVTRDEVVCSRLGLEGQSLFVVDFSSTLFEPAQTASRKF